MKKRIPAIICLLTVMCGMLTGCGLNGAFTAVEYIKTEIKNALTKDVGTDEDVNLKIIKSGVKIEEVRFDPDMGMDGCEIYKFTVPIEIKGTFQHDCKIPIYYNFNVDENYTDLNTDAMGWAHKDRINNVCKGEIEVKKGTTGTIYFEGETGDTIYSTDSSYYEHAWVSVRFADDFITDNYAAIVNPFYDSEKRPKKSYEKIRDFEPEKVSGNVYIDEDSVKVEKTYIGDEPGNPQHYKVTATICNDMDNPVSTDILRIGCEYELGQTLYPDDSYSLDNVLVFVKGVGPSLGISVQEKSMTKDEKRIQVEFDMYNRFADESDYLLGNDLDWYQSYFIALCIDDENRNDNYVIVPNPWYEQSHFDEYLNGEFNENNFWCTHDVNDVYKYDFGERMNQLFEEKGH